MGNELTAEQAEALAKYREADKAHKDAEQAYLKICDEYETAQANNRYARKQRDIALEAFHRALG